MVSFLQTSVFLAFGLPLVVLLSGAGASPATVLESHVQHTQPESQPEAIETTEVAISASDPRDRILDVVSGVLETLVGSNGDPSSASADDRTDSVLDLLLSLLGAGSSSSQPPPTSTQNQTTSGTTQETSSALKNLLDLIGLISAGVSSPITDAAAPLKTFSTFALLVAPLGIGILSCLSLLGCLCKGC